MKHQHKQMNLKQQRPVRPVHSIVIALLVLVALLLGACEGEPTAPPPAATEAGSPAAGTEPTEPAATQIPPAATEALTATTATTPTTPTVPTTPTEALPTTTEPLPPPTEVVPLPSPTQPTAAQPGQPQSTANLEFGVVAHLYYTDYERVLQLTKNAGFDWVRQQIVWKDMEMFEPVQKYVWDQLDPIVDATNAYDLKLLISIVQSPTPYNDTNGLPHDPAALGNFVEAMAERYGDKIHAYEIWNEQNLAHENGGRITPEDAGHYVEILMESYKRIKAINPNAYVLAGAPSSSGVNDPSLAISDLEYYRLMYTYKDGIMHDYFDVQAIHPGGSANPPETLWPDNPSTADGWTDHSTFYFRHIENVREVMQAHGMGDHQIWITEYGWATTNNTPGYEFGNQVSMEQQAEYITGAVRYTYENYPWLGNMFLWNMNFAVTWRDHLESLRQKADRTPEELEMLQRYWNEANPAQPLHEQAAFGILNGDWTPRPSYIELQKLITEIKTEQGRE
jgi:hypothetical protein